jgi:hypothetical protein
MLFNTLIAISLLLLLGLGVAALFLAGKSQETSTMDKEDEKNNDFRS